MMITTSNQSNTTALDHRVESTDRIQRNRGVQYPNFEQLSTSPAYRFSSGSNEELNANISTPELFEEASSSVNSQVSQPLFISLTDSFHLGDSISLDCWSEFACIFQSSDSWRPSTQNEQQPVSCETRLPHDPLKKALTNTALPQETRLDFPKSRGKYLQCYKQALLLRDDDDDGSTVISPSQAFSKDPTLSKRLEEQKVQNKKKKSSKKRKRTADVEEEPTGDEDDCYRHEDDDESEIVLGDRDVLAGRGGGSNNHPGNLLYWAKILEVRDEYQAAGERDHVAKNTIATKVLDFVHTIGGRFLERETNTRTLFALSEKRALEKIKQACRDNYVPKDLQTPQQREEYETAKKAENKKNAKNTKKNKNRRRS